MSLCPFFDRFGLLIRLLVRIITFIAARTIFGEPNLILALRLAVMLSRFSKTIRMWRTRALVALAVCSKNINDVIILVAGAILVAIFSQVFTVICKTTGATIVCVIVTTCTIFIAAYTILVAAYTVIVSLGLLKLGV